jgi:hypothetical protein
MAKITPNDTDDEAAANIYKKGVPGENSGINWFYPKSNQISATCSQCSA